MEIDVATARVGGAAALGRSAGFDVTARTNQETPNDGHEPNAISIVTSLCKGGNAAARSRDAGVDHRHSDHRNHAECRDRVRDYAGEY